MPFLWHLYKLQRAARDRSAPLAEGLSESKRARLIRACVHGLGVELLEKGGVVLREGEAARLEAHFGRTLPRDGCHVEFHLRLKAAAAVVFEDIVLVARNLDTGALPPTPAERARLGRAIKTVADLLTSEATYERAAMAALAAALTAEPP